MMVCLDTSFVIDFLNNLEDGKIIEKLEHEGEEINIPSPVISELIKGTGSKHATKSEETKINEFIDSVTTLPLDKESAVRSGKIEIELREKGEPIETIDVLIASIAIRNNEKLITKNKKHFSKIKDLEIKEY